MNDRYLPDRWETAAVSTRILVIIPAFNRSAVIGDALDSVHAQTRGASEIVVVDDGSSDDTAAVLERWKRANTSIRLAVLTTPNQGAAEARNLALRSNLPQSDYVAFLDSDDIWPADFLQRMVDALDACPDAVAATADCLLFDMQDETTTVRDHSKIPVQPHLWFLRHGGGIASCTLFRSKAIAAAGHFPAELLTGHDVAFFAKVASLGRWLHVSDVRVTKRSNIAAVHQGSADHAFKLQSCYLAQWALASKACFLEAPTEIQSSTEARRLLSKRWRRAALEALENNLPSSAREFARAALSYDRLSVKNYSVWLRAMLAGSRAPRPSRSEARESR